MNAADIQSEPSRRRVIEFYSTALVSRLNDKAHDPIILVMQRLHEEDLAGYLLAQGGWHHLNLPSIATEDASIPIGLGRLMDRKRGDVLHAAREDLASLEALKAEMGSLTFSAQYQQAPLPLEGNLIKRAWIESWSYEVLPTLSGMSCTVQSWDIASSLGENNDYSVCITAVVTKSDVFIVHVWMGRLTFPDLRRKIADQATRHKPTHVIIEEAGAGLALLQDLRLDTPQNMVKPIGLRPEGSKLDRMSIEAAKIESGMVHLPKDAPWLDDYLVELLGFPATRHDDQVDATSQLLKWWSRWKARPVRIISPGIVIIPRNDRMDATRYW